MGLSEIIKWKNSKIKMGRVFALKKRNRATKTSKGVRYAI